MLAHDRRRVPYNLHQENSHIEHGYKKSAKQHINSEVPHNSKDVCPADLLPTNKKFRWIGCRGILSTSESLRLRLPLKIPKSLLRLVSTGRFRRPEDGRLDSELEGRPKRGVAARKKLSRVDGRRAGGDASRKV